MPYVLIRHKVEDYARWRPVYDENDPPRDKYGLKKGKLLRNTDDPQELVLIFEIEDEERAREFLGLKELRQTMKRSGVIDEPSVYFLEVLEPALV